MPTISIHLTESEYNLVRQHIENKGLTISQYIKATLLEEIEDEYDATIVNAYVQEKDSMEFLTFEEAYKEWDFTHFFGFYNIFWGGQQKPFPQGIFFYA